MKLEEALNILNNGVKEDKPSRHVGDPEHKLQVQCVRWFRYQYPDVRIWANANGGQRNLITAQKLKAEGVLRGVPDLTIAAARKGFHGLYVEMKNGKKNNPTDDQKAMIEYLRKEGYKAEVARSFDEFYNIVTDYLD